MIGKIFNQKSSWLVITYIKYMKVAYFDASKYYDVIYEFKILFYTD